MRARVLVVRLRTRELYNKQYKIMVVVLGLAAKSGSDS